jgi:pimeloyl-ACP methyl ester carboxylesterase
MTAAVNHHTAPPSKGLMLIESRALWELSAFFGALPLLRLAPRGDGHPVLVLPGLGTSDVSTRPLRAFLRAQGWAAHGWRIGPNHGPREGVEERMQQRLADLYERYGQRVSVVGWSLGGVFAREVARRAPDQVRQVITLGSPISGHPKATNAWRLYEFLSQRKVDDWPHIERMRTAPPVPSTAIYSRSDGIVAWQCSLEQPSPTTDNIEVEGSHCGLGHNPLALYAVADRLALPADGWRPFERRGWRAFAYRDPMRDAAGVAAAQRRPLATA